MVKVKEKDAKSKASELLLRRKAIHTANKAAQRCDTDYPFLHDCVSDIFAQCLKAEYKREQLAAANEIDPSDAALLPHDILSYIKYPELEQEANVKWKKMVEVFSKQGKLKNWLAV
ncbi:hypothetical protein ACFX14_036128 [Malus domestica]